MVGNVLRRHSFRAELLVQHETRRYGSCGKWEDFAVRGNAVSFGYAPLYSNHCQLAWYACLVAFLLPSLGCFLFHCGTLLPSIGGLSSFPYALSLLVLVVRLWNCEGM